jgi:hypothetical protein
LFDIKTASFMGKGKEGKKRGERGGGRRGGGVRIGRERDRRELVSVLKKKREERRGRGLI